MKTRMIINRYLSKGSSGGKIQKRYVHRLPLRQKEKWRNGNYVCQRRDHQTMEGGQKMVEKQNARES